MVPPRGGKSLRSLRSVAGGGFARDGAWVTSNFSDVLRVEAELGRTFIPEESVEGRHRVMVLSDAFWRGRFGADPSIVGQMLRIRGEEIEVVTASSYLPARRASRIAPTRALRDD